MEIERKFLISKLPENLSDYPSHQIEQGYLTPNPVVRIRRQDDDYILTYKGGGMMAREEYNLPLTKEAYEQLRPKIEGVLIAKRRYCIPLEPYTIELDVFEGDLDGMILAEVEFPNIDEAEAFCPPEWFVKDVTFSPEYHNSYLAMHGRKPVST